MSNIIREIFVEDHVQYVSTSIKETLRELYLLRHARDFKFFMSQALWRVKRFAFFKKCLFIYDSASLFSSSLGIRVFRRFLKFFFLYGVITDVSSIFIRSILNFKFFMSQALWRVKRFAFFKKCLFIYDSASLFSSSLGIRVFRRFLKFFFLYGVITDVSSIFIRLFDLNLLRISVKRNFYSRFIVHFSFYHIMYDVAQQL